MEIFFVLFSFKKYAKSLVLSVKQNHKMAKLPKWGDVKVGIFKDIIIAVFG